MSISLELMRQVVAILFASWFYAIFYNVGSDTGVPYGLPRQLVEMFILAMLFYGVFFIGKVFVLYWRNVEPKPTGVESSVICLFEYIYLPIVAIFFPIYLEETFLSYKMEKQGLDFLLFCSLVIVLFVLFDLSGKIRDFIFEQNMKIRKRSLLEMEDILNADSPSIKRSSLMFYFIVFPLIGVLSFSRLG